EPGELVGGELEAEHVEVLPESLGTRRLREGDDPLGEMPSEHRLRRANLVRLGDRDDLGDVIEPVLALAERAPGLGADPERLLVGAQRALLESRVQLDLIDGGHHRGPVDELREVDLTEVRDPDGPGPAAYGDLLEREPGVEREAL